MNSRQHEHRVHRRRCQITKIISGGQTGVDQAALEAAKESSLMTGGWMPFGFKTLTGPRPDFEQLYQVQEHESTGYLPRTEANVMDSDATLCIAVDPGSPGELCTQRYIKLHRKPSFLVVLDNLSWCETDTGEKDLSWTGPIMDWIRLVNPRVLNVAGNSEQTSKNIQARAKKLLLEVFAELKIGKFKPPEPTVRIIDVQSPAFREELLETLKNKQAVVEQDLRDVLKVHKETDHDQRDDTCEHN